MTILLILIIAIAFAIIAYKKLELATLILIGALPLYVIRFSFLSLPTTLLEILIGLLFIIWFFKNYNLIFTKLKQNFKKGQINKRYPFDWELIVWLIIALASAMSLGLSLKSLGIWRAYFFEPALLFIIFVNLINTKEKIIKVAYTLSISALVISIIAAFQYFTGLFIPNAFWSTVSGRRATSLFSYPNAIGLYLAPIMFFLAGTASAIYKKNKSWFIFIIISILFSLAAILFAKSEGAIFAVIAATFIGLIIANKKTRIIALALVIIGLVGILASPKVKNYIVDRVTLNNFSGQVRRIQWRETINMLYHGHLVLGAGLTNYQTAVAPFHQVGFFFNKEKLNNSLFLNKIKTDKNFRDSHWQPLEIYLYPHNIILNFWSELGILGVLLFLWLMIKYFYKAIKSYKLALKNHDQFSWLILGLILTMLAVIIHGIVDVPYFKNDLAILFWLWLALVGVISSTRSPLSRG
jgi:MFS family permease